MSSVSNSSDSSTSQVYSAIRPFLAGSLAGCCSATVMTPVDLVKVRLQAKVNSTLKVNGTEPSVPGNRGSGTTPSGTSTSSKPRSSKLSVYHITRNIYLKEGGIHGFYRGISAVWLRQIIYKGAVLGLYDVYADMAKRETKKQLSPLTAAFCAASAAACASIIGNPTDRALVLMQTDRMLPVGKRKNYRHAIHALVSVVREEGVLRGCFTGVQATALRAVSLNVGFLAGNTVTKQFLGSSVLLDKIIGRWQEGKPNIFVDGNPSTVGHNCERQRGLEEAPTFARIDNSSHMVVVSLSALVAAGLSCVTSLPADFVRVQLMAGLYKRPMDCIFGTLRTYGPSGFYTGFGTYFLKQAPMATLTLLFQDRIKRILPE